MTAIPLNPYVVEQSDCVFGCEGHLCHTADGCAPNLICKNSVCQQNTASQPGQIGDRCNSKQVCQEHIRCVNGECQGCSTRQTIQPAEAPRKRTIANDMVIEQAPRNRIAANSPQGSCYTDSLPSLIALSHHMASANDLPICQPPTGRGNPCESAMHCDADSYCSWGMCTRCTLSDACLGAPCRSNAKCKTGFCNAHGRCDYPGQKKKTTGPGGARGRRDTRMAGVPKGHERGPAKVRDEAMRINIPKEMVTKTGLPKVIK